MPGGSSRDGEDAIPTELWESIGLTPAEIATYETLLRSGPVPASTIAKGTHQSRGRSYQTLRSLVERGLVREQPTEPILYAPVEPAEVLQALVAASKRRVFELEGLLERAPEPRRVAAAPVAGPAARVAVLRGRRAVLSETLRLTDLTRDQLCLAGGGRFTSRLRAQRALLTSIEAASARGVRVAVAALPLEPGLPASSLFPGLRGPFVATLPWERPLPVNLVVGDSTVLLISPEPDDTSPLHGDDVCVRLDGAVFAAAFSAWFSTLLQPPAGGPPTGAATPAQLLDAIGDGRREILVMGAGTWVRTPEGEALRAALKDAAARGVAVRLVMDSEPATWRWARPLVGPCSIHVAQSVPVWATIVDQAACFLLLPSQTPGEPDGMRRSRDLTEASHIRALFEQFWAKATPVTV